MKQKKKNKKNKLSLHEKIHIVSTSSRYRKVRIATIVLIVFTIIVDVLGLSLILPSRTLYVSDMHDKNQEERYEKSESLSYSYTFTDPSQYTYEEEKLVVQSGVASLASQDQIDNDNDNLSGFGAGTFSETEYDMGNTALQLTGLGKTNGIGSYTSRVMDATASTEWNTIAWNPTKPYEKELPGNKGVESGYSSGNASMANNVLLWHLNEASLATSASDSSGTGNNATITNSSVVTGMFHNARSFPGGSTNNVIMVNPVSSFPTTAITAECWVKTGVAATHGILSYASSAGNNDFLLFNTGNITIYRNNVSIPTGVSISDNTWHHLAVSWESATGATRLYLDGQSVFSGTLAPGTSITGNGSLAIGQELDSIGGGFDAAQAFNGSIDELAIFNTVLQPSSIQDHYERGALRSSFQVRTCANETCTGENFLGPDGTTNTAYSELINTTTTPPVITLTNVNEKQYFQYKVTLETDNSNSTPAITTISVAPEHFDATTPTIANISGLQATTIHALQETLGPNNEGIVYYQVSPNGINWYIYKNEQWKEVSNETSTIIEINKHIDSFLQNVNSEQFFFKAYLETNDPQKQIELDNIEITYSTDTNITPTPEPSLTPTVIPATEPSTAPMNMSPQIFEGKIEEDAFSIEHNVVYQPGRNITTINAWLKNEDRIHVEYAEGDFCRSSIKDETGKAIAVALNIEFDRDGVCTMVLPNTHLLQNQHYFVNSAIQYENEIYTTRPTTIQFEDTQIQEADEYNTILGIVSSQIESKFSKIQKNVQILLVGSIVIWVIVIMLFGVIFQNEQQLQKEYTSIVKK